jgi:hypothetical protein
MEGAQLAPEYAQRDTTYRQRVLQLLDQDEQEETRQAP